MLNLNGKSILITGGTGSLGKALTKHILLNHPKLSELIIFSRDERKQFQMSQEFSRQEYKQLRYIIGDVRDLESVKRAFHDVNYVIHAAAMKHVHISENNPDECVKTNINGAQNVIEAAIRNNVERVVALSTDKACAPTSLYGATKLVSDKLFIAANTLFKNQSIKFSVVRYGNVMGSSDSLIPFFINKKENENILPITDIEMTRFNISEKGSVKMVMYALNNAWGGELFVPKLPSFRVKDVADAICAACDKPIVGLRPGEKIHEEMITASDSLNTYLVDDYYVILPSILNWSLKNYKTHFNAVKVKRGFSYNSKDNSNWETVDSLRLLIDNYLQSID